MTEKDWNPGLLLKLSGSYWQTCALHTAVKLDLFTVIGLEKIAAKKIGRFNTVLLLTLFYFLILAPLGLIFKLFGWDPLNSRKSKHQLSTNWHEVRDKEPDMKSLSRQS